MPAHSYPIHARHARKHSGVILMDLDLRKYPAPADVATIGIRAVDGAKLAPTRIPVRFVILAMLVIGSAINLGDRANLSIAGSAMVGELGISPLTLGALFSAFAIAYVLAQLPAGWLLDRFDAHKVYGVSLILWSVCTLLQGFVGWLPAAFATAALFALRFMLGLMESPLSPANSYITATWFSTRERGLATSIYNSAQYLSVLVFVPIMGYIVHLAGWRSVFWFMGTLGLAFAVAWFAWVRHPYEHPKISQSEIECLREGGALLSAKPVRDSSSRLASLRAIPLFLRSRMMLGIYLSQYCLTSLQYFFLTWFPIYLVKGRGLDIVTVGLLAMAPAIAGFVGGLLGGWLSDLLTRRGARLSVARKVPFVLGMLLATSLVACNFVSSPYTVVFFMTIAIFGKGLAAVNWAVVADTSPPELVGIAGGLFNLFGSLSGIVTPLVIGYVVQTTGSFTVALYFVAAHGAVGALAYLLVSGRIRRLGAPA
jgi:MFS transporter, ACS family, glucarate transporter